MKIIQQGAEAVISREGNFIVKNRVKKGYRIPVLDTKLRERRTKSEAKILEKASKIISVPKVLRVEKDKLELEFIDGKKLSEFLDTLENKNEVMTQAGQETAKLHDSNIIHGDLTTSNMIYVSNEYKNVINENPQAHERVLNINKKREVSSESKGNISEEFTLFFIDFGLSFISPRIEDKAVDLHLISQALEAKHFKFHKELFSSFLKGYKSNKDYDKTLEQLKKVEARGRYKH